MTSASKEPRAGWSCGFSKFISGLAWMASLEFPEFARADERASQNKPPAASAPPKPTSCQDPASTMPAPKLRIPRRVAINPTHRHTFPATFRPLSTSGPPRAAWTGRTPEDHAVNRTDGKDVQSQPSQQAMKERGKDESNSFGINERGGEQNKKAEQDKPHAPKPVIGMNDERGGKGH